MTDKEKKIMNTFENILPLLSEAELDRIAAFGDGLSFKANQQKAVLGASGSASPPALPPAG